MNKEVTKAGSTAVTIADTMQAMGMTSEDIQIPRLMLMQNTSEFVGDGNAKLGDIVNSQTLEVLGGLDKAVELLPLKFFKTWRTYDTSGGTPKLMSVQELNSGNAGLKTQGETEDGVPFKRYNTFNFLVLLKSEADAGEAFPALIMFKSTGLQAGKSLATHFVRQAAFGQKPYAKTVMLTVTKQKKETNTYAVFGIGAGNKLDPKKDGAIIAQAERWAGLAVSQIKTEDHEDSDLSTTAPHVNTTIEDSPY